MTKKQFENYHSEINSDECLEDKSGYYRLTDSEAKLIIEKSTKCKTINDFQILDVVTRDKKIEKLKQKGLSIRQISRLTGISFGIVRKI